MRDLGNTVIVVEHDEETIMSADWVIDMGPGAGVHGGEIVAQGDAGENNAKPGKSLTGAYLSGRMEIAVPGSAESRTAASCRSRAARPTT